MGQANHNQSCQHDRHSLKLAHLQVYEFALVARPQLFGRVQHVRHATPEEKAKIHSVGSVTDQYVRVNQCRGLERAAKEA